MSEEGHTERLEAALAGRYRIERKLGEGGMASVYLAEDVKHERKVALKILKPELAAVIGAERFLSEIKTTANLQHPHILALFDSGEASGYLYYVMPYIDGETLREKLDREKQLGVEESVRIARDVADALDYAHRNGVIHRDIKPGNILLHDGRPVVADFGIALAVSAAGGGRMTETGLSLGTPHYMSPEQASADRDLSARSDVYSLGCVLYEMIAGQPPHTGPSAQSILVRILTKDPTPLTELRHTVPPHVAATVAKSIEKLPADRFETAGQFMEALDDAGFTYQARPRTTAVEQAALVAPAPVKGHGRSRLTLGLTGLAAGVVLGLVLSALRPGAPGHVTRVSVQIPLEERFHPTGADLDLSPDGSFLVYRGVGLGGQPQLRLRRWNALESTPIRGTDGARLPAISPDGQEVAFQAGGSIRVVPVVGGVSRVVSEGSGRCCPAWSSDGAWLYFSDPPAGLRRVSVADGATEIVTEVDREGGDQVNVLLDVLPNGRGVVFMTEGRDGDRIQVVNVETGEVTDLTPGSFPRYSSTGHLLFIADDGVLSVAPFDQGSLRLTGAAVPVADGVALLGNGTGFVSVSETGTLVYVTGGAGGAVTPVWVDRNGGAREIDPGWSVTVPSNSGPALSPQGTHLALSITDADLGSDVWVKPVDGGPPQRLTFTGGSTIRPRWSPSGSHLTFLSDRAGDTDLWSQRADGGDTATLVLDRDLAIQGATYSPDSTWLVFREGVNEQADIYAHRLPMDGEPSPLEVTDFQERAFALSPDGRWLAFVSNRTGPNQVFLRPFPEAGTSLYQVSTDGGTEPMWSRTTSELFYVNGSQELVAVTVRTDGGFSWSQPEVLFPVTGYQHNAAQAMYDVTADGQRFVMMRLGEGSNEVASELILVENWAEELREWAGGNR